MSRGLGDVYKRQIPALNTINKNNYFDIAQLYKEIGKAIMWAEETIQLGSSSKYFNSAEEFYYHVVIDDSYKCVQRAENLILLKNIMMRRIF